jgi:8-hydroxy-5-deazaflavin:NADPH oxidoreductase
MGLMHIAVIGAGQVGQALGEVWRGKDHSVVYGVRSPHDTKYAGLGAERLKRSADAARAAEVVVLTTPWAATEAACKDLGDLSGKIVLDCTNPLGQGPDGLELVVGFNTSAGELVAGWCPGAHVFKTFNQTGFVNMTLAAHFSPKATMFVAGDDETHKPTVLALVADVGFEAIDAGPLKNARLLEPMAMLWIDQVMKRRMDPHCAFALTRRPPEK